jgi:hypothetical protein
LLPGPQAGRGYGMSKDAECARCGQPLFTYWRHPVAVGDDDIRWMCHACVCGILNTYCRDVASRSLVDSVLAGDANYALHRFP